MLQDLVGTDYPRLPSLEHFQELNFYAGLPQVSTRPKIQTSLSEDNRDSYRALPPMSTEMQPEDSNSSLVVTSVRISVVNGKLTSNSNNTWNSFDEIFETQRNFLRAPFTSKLPTEP